MDSHTNCEIATIKTLCYMFSVESKHLASSNNITIPISYDSHFSKRAHIG
jgi:hypothetical protein